MHTSFPNLTWQMGSKTGGSGEGGGGGGGDGCFGGAPAKTDDCCSVILVLLDGMSRRNPSSRLAVTTAAIRGAVRMSGYLWWD